MFDNIDYSAINFEIFSNFCFWNVFSFFRYKLDQNENNLLFIFSSRQKKKNI